MAERHYASQRYAAAALVSATALESCLKRLCRDDDPRYSGHGLETLNSRLFSKGVYTQNIFKHICQISEILNGGGGGVSSKDARETIRFTIKFIANYLK